jgi:hypothetical protein
MNLEKIKKNEFVQKTRKMYLDSGYKESQKFPGRFVESDDEKGLLITAYSLDSMFDILSKVTDEQYDKYFLTVTSMSCRVEDLDEFGNKKPGEYIFAPYVPMYAEPTEEMIQSGFYRKLK